MRRPLPSIVPALLVGCFVFGSGCSAATGETAKGKPASSPSGAVAAKVGDTTITIQTVDEKAASNLMKVRQQEYEVRQQALEALINDDLFEREAKCKGVTTHKLSDEDIRYNDDES